MQSLPQAACQAVFRGITRTGAMSLRHAAACFPNLILKAVDVHRALNHLRLPALHFQCHRLGMLEIRQENTALGANDAGVARKLLPDGLDRLCHAAAGIGQHKAAVIIGAVLVDVHLFGLHLLRVLSGEDAQKAQIVDADIQQRTAAQTGIKLAVLPGTGGHKAVLTGDLLQFSDGASRKELAQAVVQRQQPDPERLHEEAVLFLCQTVQLPCLFRVDGKGLFAQNVLALLQTEFAVFVMQGVGSGNIDGLHLRVGGKGFVGVVAARDAVLLCKCLCAFQMPGAHGNKLLPFCAHLFHRRCKFFGNGAGG